MLLARHYRIAPTEALYERPAWEIDLLVAAVADDLEGIDMGEED